MEPPAAAATTRTLPRRLFWTAVLVLVALGGAGLATAADRPATGALRPELWVRADRHAEGWLQGITAQLHAVDGGMRQLTGRAREVLGSIQRLEPDALGTLLDDGDTVATDVDAMVVLLGQMRAAPPPGLDQTRLSPANRQILAGVDEVLAATATGGATWRELSRTTRTLATLMSSIFEHESLVFGATTAGREERWQEALDLLEDGRAALAVAFDMRDQLADANGAGTLDDLLGRYVAYSDALTNLYTMLGDGAPLDSPDVIALAAQVDAAQAALPPDNDALRVVVSETGGGTIAEAVLALERARGVVARVVGSLP